MAEHSTKPAGAAATTGDERPPTLLFDHFALDLARTELRRDGSVVPLRPKAFDLLAALAARPGQVLTKGQLMQAVWPDVVVTDDSLTHCVHELRQALGDRGPELVRTVPRRGYRLDAEPKDLGGGTSGAATPAGPGAATVAASGGSAAPDHSPASVVNLERLDRDGSQTYSGKTFMLFSRREFASMLRNTTEWTSRHRLPLAFGAHGGALTLNARFDEAVPVIERALRLGPRDPFRAEWQYRLALAHWGAGRYELARDWSQAAADTTPTLVWPPIHAAAMSRLGQIAEAKQAYAQHAKRHPGFTTAQVAHRMPGTEPAYVAMRERLVSSLRELGLP